jgi:hypothetical protein
LPFGRKKENISLLTNLTLFSSIGIGMVCGWLTGLMVCQGNRLLRNILFLGLGNIIIGLFIFCMTDLPAVLVFSASYLALLAMYLIWRRIIRNHNNLQSKNGGNYA